MTLDSLNCYEFEFSENFAGFRRFGRQQQLIVLSMIALKPTECIFEHYVPCLDLPQISSLGAFVHALLSRAYLSVS